jgi:hypothetical protein
VIKERYVPSVWPYLPITAMAAAEARAENPNMEKRKKWGATKPLAPFHFEQREKTRPMSIMQVSKRESPRREVDVMLRQRNINHVS